MITKNQTNLFIGTKYSSHLLRKMHAATRNNTGSPPMMVALIDSIGIAAELSCWGNNAMNSVQKVITERQRENAAFSGIQLLEEVIKNNDYADNESEFYQELKRQNDSYLKNARNYNSDSMYDNFLLIQAEQAGIEPWDTQQKLKGKRVLDIFEQSSQSKIAQPPEVNGQFAFSLPSLEGTYPDKFMAYGLKDQAATTVKYIYDNYLIETIGEEKYSRFFEDIFSLKDDSDKVKIQRLKSELEAINQEFSIRAETYKKAWHQKNQTQLSGEQRWRKYQVCLNKDYETYKREYAAYLKETDEYVSGLLNDLIIWVDCLKQKSQHPLSLTADDLERDSDNYLAFANDILMTLGVKSDSDKVTNLFENLIEDKSLDGHNLVWSSVLAGRKLDKGAQRKCVNFLLSLSKNIEMSALSFGQLLDKLSTVLDFYPGSSIENSAVLDLASQINGISESVFTDAVETDKKLDTAKEILTLFDAKCGELGESNSPQAQIQAAYIKPIKEVSSAAMMALLKYLQRVGGTISSEFAQAWFVASMPSHVSKSAIDGFMKNYYSFIGNLKQSMLRDIDKAGNKMAEAYQKLSNATKNVLSSHTVGRTLIGGLLVYQIYSICTLLSDKTLKTRTQQIREDLKLGIAATASISLSFRLAATYAQKDQVGKSLLTRLKFTGNFFGFLSGIIKGVNVFWADNSDKSAGEKKLFWVASAAEFVGTVDLFFQLGKTSLIEFVNKKSILVIPTIKNVFLKVLASMIIEQLFMRVILILVNPWVNLGLFIVQLISDLTKEDDIQIWLKRCRFGQAQLSAHQDYYDRYTSSEQEVKALRAIFEKFEKQAAEYQAEQAAIKAKKDQKSLESSIWVGNLQNPINMIFK